MNNHDNTGSPSLSSSPASPIRLAMQPATAARCARLLRIAPAIAALTTAGALVAPMRLFSMMPAASADAAAAISAAPAPMQAPAAGDDKKPAGQIFDANQTAALRGHLGEFVEVRGTPVGTGQSKSGAALYLNFSRQRGAAVTGVFFLPKGNATPASGAGTRPASVEDLKQFIGKNVIVKGQLSDYQGDVQMVIPYLEQIKVQ